MRSKSSVVVNSQALALSLAVMGAVLSGCDQSPAEQARELVEEARKHYNNGGLDAAAIELKNALQVDGGNADARLLLGTIYLDQGDGAGAEKELLRAADLGRSEDAVRLLLVRAHLLQFEYQEALDLTSDAAYADSEDEAALMVGRGEALLGLGDLDQADETFRKVLEFHHDAKAYVGLAKSATVRNERDEAVAVIEQGLERFPEDAELLSLAGAWQLRDGRYEESERTYEMALKASSDNLSALVGLTRVQISRGRFGEAEANLRKLAAVAPQSPSVVLLRGVLAFESQDYDAAKNEMERVLAHHQENLTALYVAGASSYVLNQNERARSWLEQYVNAVPNNLVARRLLAATLHRLNEQEAALDVLGGVAPESIDDGDYLSLVGSAALNAGDLQSGAQYLEHAVERNPDSATLRARLGATRIAAGDVEGGHSQLESALEIDPQLEQAERTLLLSYLQQKRYEDVIVGAERYSQAYPDSTFGHMLRGMAYVGQGAVNDARRAFNRALEIRPGAPDASANLAALEARSGNVDQAKAVLKGVLVHHPGHLRTLMQLSRIALNQRNAEEAKGWLRQAAESNPQMAQPAAELAGLHLLAREYETALAIAQESLRAHPTSPALLAVAGEAQLRSGETVAAIETLNRLIAVRPNSINSRLLLVEALRKAGRLDQARRQLDASLAVDSEHLETKIVLADLLLNSGSESDRERARALIQELAERSPSSGEVVVLQGEMALQDGDPQTAVGFFSKADEGVNNRKLTVALARAHWESGNREASNATLRTWINENPKDVLSHLLLSRNYQQMERFDDAEAVLLEVTQRQPTNWLALNQLALLRLLQRDASTARQYAEQAMEASGKHPFVMGTLGRVHLALNEDAEALDLLEAADSQSPGNHEIMAHLAQALARNGRNEEARALLRDLLSDGSEFDGRPEAEALLDQLGG